MHFLLPLPPFVQSKARTLSPTGGTGLSSVWLIGRVQLVETEDDGSELAKADTGGLSI